MAMPLCYHVPFATYLNTQSLVLTNTTTTKHLTNLTK